MQLFTTYGVQSSVPAKTVVAVITPQIEANTQNYSFSITQNNRIDDGIPKADSAATRSNIIQIQNNSIIFSDLSLVGSIQFYSSSNQNDFISSIPVCNDNTTSITIPSNATHFAFWSYKLTSFCFTGVSASTFSTITVSYSTTPPATVTFFDEYPNGTQIGDVVEVTGTPPVSVDPPATYKIRQLVFE